MVTRRIFSVILVLCSIVISGCTVPIGSSGKTVSEDNVFSSPLPKFKVQINPGLKYLEEFNESISTNNAYHRNIHFFGDIDERNVYQKGIIFEYVSLPSGFRWRGAPGPSSDNAIKNGTMKWGDNDAKYIIGKGTPFSEEEKIFLTEKAYKLPQCCLLKISGREHANTRLYITYFDQSFPCNEGLSSEDIEIFLQNSLDDMIFQ